MADLEAPACSNPGCNQPGTNKCSACKITCYCGPICQTADWSHHKEECPGHLRKVGMASLVKAQGFERQQNYLQSLRYAELAATKLKQLKGRSLETVEQINAAMMLQFHSLTRLGRYREGMECIKECYTMWAMNHLRNPGSMTAALGLIESCLHNKEFEDAERYARHAYFMIAEMTDNFIPIAQQPRFLAEASYYLAISIRGLSMAGGIPPEGKQKAGEEAIALARKALEINTQLFGAESSSVAMVVGSLADLLDCFGDVDNDETLRLQVRAIAIYRRLQGNSSFNVSIGEHNLGVSYSSRANRARDANHVDRWISNLELALPHYREAARISRAIGHVDRADQNLREVATIEDTIRRVRIAKAVDEAAGIRF